MYMQVLLRLEFISSQILITLVHGCLATSSTKTTYTCMSSKENHLQRKLKIFLFKLHRFLKKTPKSVSVLN